MRQEIVRKLAHTSSIILPLCYLVLSKAEMLCLVWPITIIMVCYDLIRISPATSGLAGLVRMLSDKLGLSSLFRRSEVNSFSGGSYMLITASVLLLMLPEHIFVLAFMVLAVSDSLAAIVGIRFGRIKFLGKSLEGALAFFGSACIISWLGADFLGVGPFLPLLLASLVATLVEFVSGRSYFGGRIRADDNMTIPIAYSATLVILGGF